MRAAKAPGFTWLRGVCVALGLALCLGMAAPSQASSTGIGKKAEEVLGLALLGTLVITIDASLVIQGVRSISTQKYSLPIGVLSSIFGSLGVGVSTLYMALDPQASKALCFTVLGVHTGLAVLGAVQLGLWAQSRKKKPLKAPQRQLRKSPRPQRPHKAPGRRQVEPEFAPEAAVMHAAQ